jgi:hypothetical protein
MYYFGYYVLSSNISHKTSCLTLLARQYSFMRLAGERIRG